MWMLIAGPRGKNTALEMLEEIGARTHTNRRGLNSGDGNASGPVGIFLGRDYLYLARIPNRSTKCSVFRVRYQELIVVLRLEGSTWVKAQRRCTPRLEKEENLRDGVERLGLNLGRRFFLL